MANNVARRTAVVASIVLLVSGLTPGSASASVAPPVLPETGALFGAYVKADATMTGPTRATAMANVEAAAGRGMALDRQYYLWDQSWPTADDAASASQGRTLFISWSAKRLDGTFVSWSGIANGFYDAVIDQQAAALISFDQPVFFSFNHEPENDDPAGTPQDFIAAFQHVRDQFIADGVTNVSYAWTMMAWSFRIGSASSYYPGNAYVDVIAADGYTWYGCNSPSGPWRSFSEVFQPFYSFGVGRGKPMVIAEWGATEDPAIPGRKATWINEAGTQLKSWPEIKGVMYFDTNAGCARWINSSPPSQAAFATMGADPYFNPTPSLIISSGPAIWSMKPTADLSFAGSATGGVGLMCSLDGATPMDCGAGSASYTELGIGDHDFSVWQVDVDGTQVGGTGHWFWTVLQGAKITVSDSGFSPFAHFAPQGATVLWSAIGPSEHTVTDASGMGLFDSGPLGAGSTITVTFDGAGIYPYGSTLDPSMTGVVKVPILVTPATGSPTSTFSVRWAPAPPPADFVYDVQIKHPGHTWSRWTAWGTAATSSNFVPDVGAGTYLFRARLRRQTTGHHSHWSVGKKITVS
jgi:plastocyanin